VFYHQHNPASWQEKAVATSLHFMGMFASRPMEVDYPLSSFFFNRPRFSVSSLFPLATIQDRDRARIGGECEDPLVTSRKNFC
jgi:hypothetical protein